MEKIKKQSIVIFLINWIFLIFLIIFHHFWSTFAVPPIHDASNCIVRASNIGLLMSRGDFFLIWNALKGDLNNFLSVTYISMWNLLIGPGRIAWGFAFATFFSVWIFILVKFIRRSQYSQFFYTVSLLIVSSHLFSRSGGLLDQRFDPLSVIALTISTFFLFKSNIQGAFLFSVISIFAKGPAVPIVGLIWISAFISRIVTFRNIRWSIKSYPKTWISTSLVALIYLWVFMPQVISYNLMAVNTNSNGNWQNSVIKAWITLSDNLGYYFYVAIQAYPFILLVFTIAFFGIIVFPIRLKKVFVFACLLWIGIYLLFSSHPVKSPVLMIWLIPGTFSFCWIAGYVITRIVANLPFTWVIQTVISILVITMTLRGNYGEKYELNNVEKEDHIYMVNLSDHIVATFKQKNFSISHALLLVNFLYGRSPKATFNYDSFRVLILERMGRSAPVIDGWELGTHSDDWYTEIGDLSKSPYLIFLIGQDPFSKIHPFGRGTKIAQEVDAMLKYKCPPALFPAHNHSDLGVVSMYITRSDFSCTAF